MDVFNPPPGDGPEFQRWVDQAHKQMRDDISRLWERLPQIPQDIGSEPMDASFVPPS